MPELANQPRDIEKGDVGDVDDHLDPQLTQDQPLQRENSGDSSWPLFSMYSKTKEEEDNKIAEYLQKNGDGVLIFAGLFSASVAAFLSMSVQDLRPNSQDTSAFYLGKIYGVLADPNVTRTSIPSPVTKPPPFSPPRYAVWVNSLWFLSFVFSLICALVAMSFQLWARQYIRDSQPSRCSPEKRARTRAFFADTQYSLVRYYGLAEGLAILLGLSLFLFFAGLAVFLFNTNHAVFGAVICPIMNFPLLFGNLIAFQLWGLRRILPKYVPFMKTVEQKVSERSREFDVDILSWSIRAGDDDTLERVFEAIPGFFKSKLVNHLKEDFPEDLLNGFWNALNGFLCRSLSYSLTESAKSHRLNIGMKAMGVISRSRTTPCDIVVEGWDQVPQIADMVPGQLLTYCSSDYGHISHYAQCVVAKILAGIPEHDDRWIRFATGAFGLSERDLRDDDDDSVSFSIFIHLFRQSIRHRFYDLDALMAFSNFDVRNTLPGLQHAFCTLWNELVQEARKLPDELLVPDKLHIRPPPIPVRVLRRIRHLYIALHQATDAAPIAFSVSTDTLHHNLLKLSSYPSCDIASHRPDSTAHLHTTNSRSVSIFTQPGDLPDALSRDNSIAPQRAEQANIVVEPPSLYHSTTTSDIGGTSHAPIVTPLTNPVHSGPCPTDTSPIGDVAAALKDVPPTITLSHPMEGTTQRDIVPPCAEPGISEILSTPVLTRTLRPVPASTPPVPNKSIAPCDAYPTPTSNPSLGFFIPASPPPSHVPPLPNSQSLAVLDCATTGNSTLPRLHARGLVNTGSMCFANAVLQLLVHSPPFWNLFRELDDMKRQRGARTPGTGGGATPLVDATVRLFEEFQVNEKDPSSTQQPPQHAAGEKPKEDERVEKEHNARDSFKPTYMYDAIKGKRQLKTLLDSQQHDAEEFLRLYLDALDEELLSLLTSISTHRAASAALEVDEREVSQLGLSEEGKRDLTAKSVESPIARIFGGKSRSTIRAPNQPDVVTVEDWRSLRLDIEPGSVHTIQDALSLVSQPGPVQVGQSSSSEASQQVLFEGLPPILVLHLERFLYDAAANGINKISKLVQFAPGLEIPLEIMAPASGKSAEPVHYKLYGVLYHHGELGSSGHYTVDVLHPNEDSGSGESWLHIDDEAVSMVQHEDVFGPPQIWRQGTKRAADEWCAYLLFYCRTTPT